MTRKNQLLCACALTAGLAVSAPAQANDNVMVVFDGSNSMWGQIDGTAKIEIARSVMDNLLGDWTADRQVGLMAYGHRRRGDCTDIELLVEPGAETRAAILERINAITPTGKTPLTDAVEQAATALSYTDQPATVVLISDGLESRERDPCALAEALEKGGVGFTAHVVGFGLGGSEDTASLSCIAEKTGGQYLSASNAEQLGQALSAVGTAVAEAPEPEPVPEPEPEPDLPEVTVTAPATTLIGSIFGVSWTPVVSDKDYVTIVPAGAEEGTRGNSILSRDGTEGELRAPADTGLYEVRYLDRDTGKTLGATSVELTEPKVTITAPDTALTGEAISVSWTGTVDGGDYLTVVPMGAEDGARGAYIIVRDDDRATLKYPEETGFYEVRYLLREGLKTLASHRVEVLPADAALERGASLNAPDSAAPGAQIEVGWSVESDSADQRITLAKADQAIFTWIEAVKISGDPPVRMTLPDEAGIYELRFLDVSNQQVLARKVIKVE
mgnify:CR=1 FL=1